jgi:flagellar FliL protein
MNATLVQALPGISCRRRVRLAMGLECRLTQPIINDLCLFSRATPRRRATAMDEAVSMTDQAIADDLAESSEEGAVAAPRFGRKKLILFVAAPLLALLLIAAGLYFTGLLSRFMGGKSEAHEEKVVPKQTVFYDLPELLVNLSGAGRKASFLKMSISLELENQIDVARLQSVMPRIIDNFQVYLRELRIEDLRGSAGMYRLREELLLRVNASAAPARIVDVLFKEMLVQ